MSAENGGLRVTAKDHCDETTQIHEDRSKLIEDQNPQNILDWRNSQELYTVPQRGGALYKIKLCKLTIKVYSKAITFKAITSYLLYYILVFSVLLGLFTSVQKKNYIIVHCCAPLPSSSVGEVIGQLEIGPGGSIYTEEISKCYQSSLSSTHPQVVCNHLHHWVPKI